MNWALEEAKKIIEKYPRKEEYVIASGVSPSGFIHIGNFREIVTTYFIGKELERLGKKVRFILSFDDFDRFRKVPNGIPEEYEKYVGMPYTSIPSPFSSKSYAQEMEDIFVEELARLDIHPEIISQTKQYKSGRYNDRIIYAMDNRKQIFDILSKYKTQKFSDEERNNYYPISIYCDCCGKDSTKIINYDSDSRKIEYICSCNNHMKVNIDSCKNIKLQWKIDWPMRWQQEGVIFEPGGRDHSAENGSYAVSKEIAKTIFKYDPPYYTAYDFIGIKGGHGKMASSTGNVLTLSDLLSVYDKNIILWFYAKNRPSHQFNISLDEDVLRYYSEFDRLVKSYFSGTLDAVNTSILSLTNITPKYLENPKFDYIANFLPMVNYDQKVLSELLKKEGIDCDSIYYHNRLGRAINWITKYDNNKVSILENFNNSYYSTLNEKEKKWIADTLIVLQKQYSDSKELQDRLYGIVKEDNIDSKSLKKLQRRYFTILYNMILGRDNGPKLGLLLSVMNYDDICSKLLEDYDKKLVLK